MKWFKFFIFFKYIQEVILWWNWPCGPQIWALNDKIDNDVIVLILFPYFNGEYKNK